MCIEVMRVTKLAGMHCAGVLELRSVGGGTFFRDNFMETLGDRMNNPERNPEVWMNRRRFPCLGSLRGVPGNSAEGPRSWPPFEILTGRRFSM